jgi:hypothetical protein
MQPLVVKYSYPSLSIEPQFAQVFSKLDQHPDSDTNHSYSYIKYSQDNPLTSVTRLPSTSDTSLIHGVCCLINKFTALLHVEKYFLHSHITYFPAARESSPLKKMVVQKLIYFNS